MKKLFIGALVAAELAMLAGTLGGKVEFGGVIAPPPPVDGKWAKAMARKAEQDAREDASSSSHRQALDACLGPGRESFSPTRYEAKAKACEAQLAGAPAQGDEPPPFEYPKPPSEPGPAQAEAPAQPAAG